MGRPMRFAPNEAAVTDIVRGPHPVAVFYAGAIDALFGRAMAGKAGAIRAGEPSSPARKFSGELGPLQFFKGAAPLALNATRPGRGPNRALPATSGPAAAPNPILDLLGHNPPETYAPETSA